jgi:hypothetical protein
MLNIYFGEYRLYWAIKAVVVKRFLKIKVFSGFLLSRYMDKNPIPSKVDEFLGLGEVEIIFMYEPRFYRAAKELTSRGVKLGFLSRRYFDLIFKRYLWDYMNEGLRNYGEYALSKYGRYSKERGLYKKDCVEFIELLGRHCASRVVVLPKYNDDYTLEVIEAFNTKGWKVIVYDREGTVTPERLREISPIVAKIAPVCDVVVVYNAMHQAFFESVFNLSGIRPTPNLKMIGNPSSDDWFDFESKPTYLWNGSSKRVLFFAFGAFSYVYGYEYLKDKSEVWGDFLCELHAVLDQFMKKSSDAILMYKRSPKQNRDYWEGSEELLLCENVIVPNVTVNSNQLIFESDVVLAFQTTALIDAMHTNKPIIYCAWGRRYAELRTELIDFESIAKTGAIVHADSPARLLHYLSMPINDFNINQNARKIAREMFTNNHDGKVSDRFADYVVKYINIKNIDRV